MTAAPCARCGHDRQMHDGTRGWCFAKVTPTRSCACMHYRVPDPGPAPMLPGLTRGNWS